jgi:hypothetical protein
LRNEETTELSPSETAPQEVALARLQTSIPAPLILAALIIAGGSGTAAADCVADLAFCATDCARLRPEDPDRRECGRVCVSAYQRCERTAARNEVVAPRPGVGVNPTKE